MSNRAGTVGAVAWTVLAASLAAAEPSAATSQIFGDGDAGFDDSSEYILGMNLYPFKTRNHRWNVQVNEVHRSPVSSTFGYYVGGLDGTVVSTAFSIFF